MRPVGRAPACAAVVRHGDAGEPPYGTTVPGSGRTGAFLAYGLTRLGAPRRSGVRAPRGVSAKGGALTVVRIHLLLRAHDHVLAGFRGCDTARVAARQEEAAQGAVHGTSDRAVAGDGREPSVMKSRGGGRG